MSGNFVMRNAFRIRHQTPSCARKYHHLKSLFSYLIGPMKEVVQGLGVTAKTRTEIKDHNLNFGEFSAQTNDCTSLRRKNRLGLIKQDVFFLMKDQTDSPQNVK